MQELTSNLHPVILGIIFFFLLAVLMDSRLCDWINLAYSLFIKCGKFGLPLKEDSIRELDESKSALNIDTMKMVFW